MTIVLQSVMTKGRTSNRESEKQSEDKSRPAMKVRHTYLQWHKTCARPQPDENALAS